MVGLIIPLHTVIAVTYRYRYVIFPAVVGLVISIGFHTSIASEKAKELKKAKAANIWLRAGKVRQQRVTQRHSASQGVTAARSNGS